MLVFWSFPKGSTVIEGKRVYGYLEPYDPVKISWGAYKANRASLIQASYNKEILGKMFPGKEFPPINFNYHQIRHLTWGQLCALCKAFGITTNRLTKRRRRTVRRFIRRHC